jgi:hypothetical protein
MNAAERVRAAKRARYQALSRAGIHSQTVYFFLFISETEPHHYAGQAGERHYWRLTLEPNPSIGLKQRLVATSDGFQPEDEVLLKGAFPTRLDGFEWTVGADGEETEGEPVTRNYTTPGDFQVDIQAADYFLVDGIVYRFRTAGPFETDSMQSEWRLRLVRNE